MTVFDLLERLAGVRSLRLGNLPTVPPASAQPIQLAPKTPAPESAPVPGAAGDDAGTNVRARWPKLLAAAA
jgi:hypothetical protein